MFSRSEKPDDVMEVAAEASGERSPMVLAALAGLLAIAGAFLLVWYLNSGDDGAVAAGGEVVEGPNGEAISTSEATQQVLIVTQLIPRGTSVRDLIDTPTVFLAAQSVPESLVAGSAITSIAALSELAEEEVLSADALPGDQLLRARFRNPNDFDASDDTFLEAESGILAPDGHHAVVVELPSTRAFGGNIREGERVTVSAAFRVSPNDGTATYDLSAVILNSVEVLNVLSALEFQGQISQDVNQLGTANRGTLVITLAVKPEELTDLTYALEFGDITLATALPGLENEDGPRAATTITQILGDDGVWLDQLEDGNIIDLVTGQFVDDSGPAGAGRSIELDLSSQPDLLPEEVAAQDSEPESLADTIDEEEPGDS